MDNSLKTILKNKGPIRKAGVLGMGFVGIPSAVAFAASSAFEFVWGFQRRSKLSGYKIDMLNQGRCPIQGREPELEELLNQVIEANKFRCTSQFERISELDSITIAVDTSFLIPEKLIPDSESLETGLRTVGKNMSRGVLVVVESTVTPGTTEGMARQILEEESGLEAGVDFALAHAPERVMPGRLLKNIRELDRVVGGIDDVSTARAVELYSAILTKGKIIPMNARAAEVAKTAENALRDLQIAAANQLALYCEALGVNFFDVRAAIDSLKEEGVTRALLYPGAGVGGHCLPKDTYHLERGLKILNGAKSTADYTADPGSLFLLARQINNFMPQHMYRLTRSALEKAGKRTQGLKAAILGWAYNKNTNDARNTPALAYKDFLVNDGIAVRVHDPYVANHDGNPISKNLDEVLKGTDLLTIVTDHDDYRELDLGKIKEMMNGPHPIIVDGRNIIDDDEALRLGFIYIAVGRGDRNGHAFPVS